MHHFSFWFLKQTLALLKLNDFADEYIIRRLQKALTIILFTYSIASDIKFQMRNEKSFSEIFCDQLLALLL